MVITLFIALVFLVTYASLIYFAEHEAQPDDFPHIPAAMWWGIVTLTTVGYGAMNLLRLLHQKLQKL
ncbi:MAG: two pore domain potassium channel family protein [Okeania sp. SIO2C9]|nr:two pore domain potassium channel family protein [Okeania sp. SIO2C9]